MVLILSRQTTNVLIIPRYPWYMQLTGKPYQCNQFIDQDVALGPGLEYMYKTIGYQHPLLDASDNLPQKRRPRVTCTTLQYSRFSTIYYLSMLLHCSIAGLAKYTIFLCSKVARVGHRPHKRKRLFTEMLSEWQTIAILQAQYPLF